MTRKIDNLIKIVNSNKFIFGELVKRDFTKKYKRSVLGVFWSMLAPLFTLLVMNFVFSSFFGSVSEHYTIYLFSGIIVTSYYSQATSGGMGALINNASIFSKINVPKYMFLFANVASSAINFFLMLMIFFIFVVFDGLSFDWNFLLLIFPIVCLFVTVLGVSMILSALNVFFQDIQYLYSVFLTAVMYCTPIFYKTDILGDKAFLFYFNPLFLFIDYFRSIVIYDTVPSIGYHFYCMIYSSVFLITGFWVYKRYNYKFLYYL